MPARRRVSLRQMELLVEFAESHRDIALGRFPGGPQAVQVTREPWDSVAVQLNSVAEGTTKTGDQWRRYWIEFKAKTEAKAADSRRNAAATGCGPNRLIPLNEIEERVLALIGPVAVTGLPGVRLPMDIPTVDVTAPADSGIVAPADPVISYPSTSTSLAPNLTSSEPSTSSAPHPISSEPLMDVEWLEEEIPSPLGLQPELQTFAPPPPHSPETQPADTADMPAQSDEQPEVSREDRHPRVDQRSIPPARRSRLQRQIRREERAPRWAYDIETRRVAAEERHAAAMEAMVDLLRQIRDDVHNYVHRK